MIHCKMMRDVDTLGKIRDSQWLGRELVYWFGGLFFHTVKDDCCTDPEFVVFRCIAGCRKKREN